MKITPQQKGDEILLQLGKSAKIAFKNKPQFKKNYVVNMAIEVAQDSINFYKPFTEMTKSSNFEYNVKQKQFWTEVKQYLITKKLP